MARIGSHAGSDSNAKKEVPHIVRPKITAIVAADMSTILWVKRAKIRMTTIALWR
jgi:hypothetical protein